MKGKGGDVIFIIKVPHPHVNFFEVVWVEGKGGGFGHKRETWGLLSVISCESNECLHNRWFFLFRE